MVHGIPVYIQEKAEEFYNSQYSDKVKLPFSKDAEDSFNNNDDLHYINPIWTIRAIEYYGEERVLDFIQWAKDNGVAGDLHTGNIGFTAEGKPIILDWAGFRD